MITWHLAIPTLWLSSVVIILLNIVAIHFRVVTKVTFGRRSPSPRNLYPVESFISFGTEIHPWRPADVLPSTRFKMRNARATYPSKYAKTENKASNFHVSYHKKYDSIIHATYGRTQRHNTFVSNNQLLVCSISATLSGSSNTLPRVDCLDMPSG